MEEFLDKISSYDRLKLLEMFEADEEKPVVRRRILMAGSFFLKKDSEKGQKNHHK